MGTYPNPPFHEQPITCFVAAEQGKFSPGHVVSPAADAHLAFYDGRTEMRRMNDKAGARSDLRGSKMSFYVNEADRRDGTGSRAVRAVS